MAAPKAAPPEVKPPGIPAASASVVVVSADNHILLLHRVQTGTFSSAHVFPGGNVSEFHEGALIPSVDSTERHVDGPAYRLTAIRETFEESGILLARPRGAQESSLLRLSDEETRQGRLAVANEKVRFEEWLAGVGGVPDSENLIPFTRWITPPTMPRRFTTQMYLYMLPLRDASSVASQSAPTADLTEVMAAEFAAASTWMQRARNNDIILFPPQVYILSLLAPLLKGPEGLPLGVPSSAVHYAAERKRVIELVHNGRAEDENDATFVPWADRIISPRVVGRMPADDGRVVMMLDQPGPELRNSGRGGDAYRVILAANMPRGPPRTVELRLQKDVLPVLDAVKATRTRSTSTGTSKI